MAFEVHITNAKLTCAAWQSLKELIPFLQRVLKFALPEENSGEKSVMYYRVNDCQLMQSRASVS